jgi:hypothetical protein
MRLIVIAAAMLSAAAVATAVSAQPAPSEQAEALAKLKAADVNKDGKWDMKEWLAAGRREFGFNFIDADKDGFVTTAELKAGMEKMQAMRGATN